MRSDEDGDDTTVRVVSGTLPTGLVLNADGTFSGTATATGTFRFVVEVCDDETPRLCIQMPLTITVGRLPSTGSPTEGPLRLAVLLVLAGVAVLATLATLGRWASISASTS